MLKLPRKRRYMQCVTNGPSDRLTDQHSCSYSRVDANKKLTNDSLLLTSITYSLKLICILPYLFKAGTPKQIHRRAALRKGVNNSKFSMSGKRRGE